MGSASEWVIGRHEEVHRGQDRVSPYQVGCMDCPCERVMRAVCELTRECRGVRQHVAIDLMGGRMER